MHMADALLSPAVGGVMWAATAGAVAHSIKQLGQEDLSEGHKAPLMGVMGAFVFAAQMINFSIPGTGSSGHIGGGLLLAAMLGPHAGFLTMTVILAVQALFFADGGLLALGSNIFNLGFFTCFIAYPLIFKPLVKKDPTPGRLALASILAAVVGLQMGALGVVLETLFSGKTELPFGTFVLLMQPIHLAIGIVEGLITAAVLVFIHRVAPETMTGVRAALAGGAGANAGAPARAGNPAKGIAIIAILALLCGGVLSWFASANPDGLEWAMLKTAGVAELESTASVHQTLSKVQESTALLPDYGFKGGEGEEAGPAAPAAWPAVNSGATVAGVVGSAITLGVVGLIGYLLRSSKRRGKGQAVS